MVASTGLQMSQPRPVPKRADDRAEGAQPRDADDVEQLRARVASKCSHSAVLRLAPLRASSAPTSFFTRGRHEPHAAPARVHAFTPATSVQPSSVTAQRIVPAVTLLHEHTSASSGSSAFASASPAPSGMRYAAGSAPSGPPSSGRSIPYALASPTRMPPSRVCASSESTSFL